MLNGVCILRKINNIFIFIVDRLLKLLHKWCCVAYCRPDGIYCQQQACHKKFYNLLE